MAILLLLSRSNGQAILLDWNSVSWTSGQLSRSYDIDSTNPGNDITITISGDTTYLKNASPNDVNALTGGQGTSQQSLYMNADWANRSQSITITIDFNYADGVDNVNFTIFDVDYGSGSYQDKIFNILGSDGAGGVVVPTLTTSSGNQLVGSGSSQYVRGTASVGSSSANGNVGIDFGTDTVHSVSFSYGNAASAPVDPNSQDIGLYDISFTKSPRKVPEVHPGLASSLACFFVAGFRWVRARIRKKTPPSA